MFGKKKIKLVTHSGSFHADDIFACAVITMVLDRQRKTYTILRTRDTKRIQEADYVFDIGAIYDPKTNRFDHHQSGGAGARENTIPYASFGLVWKEFGLELSGTKSVQEQIDKRLVQPIDANDNGVALFDAKGEVFPYTLEGALYAYRPTWKEDVSMYDSEFEKRVVFAKDLLKREIKKAQDNEEAVVFVDRAYDVAQNKQIIELDGNYPFQEALQKYPEPLYVISKKTDSNDWRVTAVSVAPFSFENRKDLPSAWAGKRDGELAEVTGVSDAVFCHNGRFLAVAKTREGALALAKLAIEA